MLNRFRRNFEREKWPFKKIGAQKLRLPEFAFWFKYKAVFHPRINYIAKWARSLFPVRRVFPPIFFAIYPMYLFCSQLKFKVSARLKFELGE